MYYANSTRGKKAEFVTLRVEAVYGASCSYKVRKLPQGVYYRTANVSGEERGEEGGRDIAALEGARNSKHVCPCNPRNGSRDK